MARCARPSCGHPDTAHDALGMCELCGCTGLLLEEDEVLDQPESFVLDDEDEMEIDDVPDLNFDDEADR